MRTTIFQGLRIKIENEKGSIRKGVDKTTGQKWATKMAYPYGEILDSKGVDGDPVDVFLGPNRNAKFVYIVHQTDKNLGKFDEDKCFMGFNDAMEAKQAFFDSYDIPEFFYTSIETVPLVVFKKKIKNTKKYPQMIHATKMDAAIELYAKEIVEPIEKGAEVAVDGMHGRGIVQSVTGRRVIIRFPNGLYISRDAKYVHNIANRINRMWRD